MKLGLISDIHGDSEALELAWRHLGALKVDRVVCAGDVVGYGPLPDRVASFLQEHRVASVRGNHDRWALSRGAGVDDEFGGSAPSEETIALLRSLPCELVIEAGTRVGVIVHGSPTSDMEFVTPHSHPPAVLRGLLETRNCDLLVVGHTHRPMWYREPGGGLVVNPGSIISVPVVETSRTFAVVDTTDLIVAFHDVRSGRAVPLDPWR